MTAEYKEQLHRCTEKSEIMKNFVMKEGDVALKLIKNAKAADVGGNLQEFLKHLGSKGKLWLTNIFSSVKNNNVVPKLWREPKVIATLKQSKPDGDPKSYRP